MFSMQKILLTATALACLAPLSLQAQFGEDDLKDVIAYVSLLSTPTAGFVPWPMRPGATSTRPDFGVNYGHINSMNQAIFTARIPASAADIALSAGARTCTDCDTGWLLGVDATIPVASDRIHIGIRPALGYSKEGDANMLTGAVSLPISLPIAIRQGSNDTYIAPFIVPGYGIGRLSANGESESGTRPMLGAGVLFAGLGGRVSINAGVQKVFIEEGDLLFGLGMSLTGGSR